MSNALERSDAAGSTAWRPATVAGVGLSLLLFAGLVGILFWFTALSRTEAPADGKTAGQKLAELQAQDRMTLTTYGWVDRPKGFVRVPIDRAMTLLATRRARQP